MWMMWLLCCSQMVHWHVHPASMRRWFHVIQSNLTTCGHRLSANPQTAAGLNQVVRHSAAIRKVCFCLELPINTRISFQFICLVFLMFLMQLFFCYSFFNLSCFLFYLFSCKLFLNVWTTLSFNVLWVFMIHFQFFLS